jgi:O-methyltransferase domain
MMSENFPGMPRAALQMQTAIYGLFRTQALSVAASLGIADILSKGPSDLETLASATGSHARSLGRLMRFLVSEGVFTRDEVSLYGLTPLGELLRSDGSVTNRHAAIFYGSPAIWAAWGNLAEAIRTGETAFELAHGEPLFQYLDSHEDDARIFNDFMTEMARLRTAGAGYDYRGLNTVVDVGGGQGNTLVELLTSYPALKGVLFDLPAVVAGAPGVLAAGGVADRCRVLAGDFFEAVPEGGDAYVLSNILHDWDDARCLTILANCRRAMAPGTKLVVIEAIVPEGPSPMLLVDMQMMVVTGGVQRTEAEFRDLLNQTSFKIRRVAPGLLEADAV